MYIKKQFTFYGIIAEAYKDMKSGIQIVSKYFFKDNKEFTVPIYQRNYEWTEANCDLLFQDIINNMDSKGADQKNRKHFLGIFILTPNDDLKVHTHFSLIDGQQRLVTLYLFIKALYDLCSNKYMRNKIGAYLYNNLEANVSAGDENVKLKLKGIVKDLDNSTFEKILINEPSEITPKNINSESKVYCNYLFFVEAIKAYSEEHKIKLNNLISDMFKSLCNFICSIIELDKNIDDPQLVYDRINSAGVPLSLADKVRNYLLMDKNKQNNWYINYWEPMEKALLSIKKNSKTDNVSDFMKYYIMFREPSILINNKDQYYVFKAIVNRVFKGDKKEVLKDLNCFYEYYKFFIMEGKTDKDFEPYNIQIKYRVDSFAQLKIQTVYPVLFAIFDDFNKGYIELGVLQDCLDFLLKYLVRRTIFGLPSNRLTEIFKRMSDNIVNRTEKPQKDDYIKELVYQFIAEDSTSYSFIFDNDEIIEKLPSLNLYTLKGGDLCKFLLYHLEFNAHSNEIISRDKITIEHIMPQNPKGDNLKAWKKEIGEDKYDAVHEELLHKLGNLSLTGYNQKMQDKPFKYKQKEIYSNSPFIHLYSYVNSQSNWGEEQINTRNNELTADVLEWLSLPEDFITIKKTASQKSLKLSELSSFTRKKPVSFEIKGKTTVLQKSTKANLVETVCSYLYNDLGYRDIIIDMAENKKSLDGTSRVAFIINNNDQNNRDSELHQINRRDKGTSAIFVDTHQSNDEALTFLKRLFCDSRFNISEDDLIINFE